MELIRKDPPQAPPETRKQHDWEAIEARLFLDPGTWYLVAKDVSLSTVSYVRTNYPLELQPRGVNTQARRAAEVYARHTGGISRAEERKRALRIKQEALFNKRALPLDQILADPEFRDTYHRELAWHYVMVIRTMRYIPDTQAEYQKRLDHLLATEFDPSEHDSLLASAERFVEEHSSEWVKIRNAEFDKGTDPEEVMPIATQTILDRKQNR